MKLRTARLLLREFVESDATATNAYESDPDVVRYQSHGPQSFDESLMRVKRAIDSSLEVPRSVFEFALIMIDTQRLIGRCGFKLTDPDQREATLWYVAHRHQWGKGYITEAAREVIRFAFEDLNVHRIFIDADPRNVASLRVAEKLGMRKEGHFVENLWVKGEWTDSVIMAMLDREHRRT